MSSVSGPRDSSSRPVSGVFQMQQDASSPTKPMPKAAAVNAASAAGAVEPSVHYTCFIRLPFTRADFVDPQQVEWSSGKDRLLWKTISKASNSRELDWEELSTRFDVSLPFLLQQAAWLYERHFAQMKAQMKKLSPSANPSPIPPDSTSNVSTPIIGTFATNSLGPRAASALSTRARDSPTPTAQGGSDNSLIKQQQAPAAQPQPTSSTVLAPEAPFPTFTSTIPTRTPSTRTITNSRNSAANPAAGGSNSPVPPPATAPSRSSFRSSFNSQRKTTHPSQQQQPQQVQQQQTAYQRDQGQEEEEEYESPPPANFSDSDSSSDDDDDDSKESRSMAMARSQAFRRPLVPGGAGGRHAAGAKGVKYTDVLDEEYADEEEDDEDGDGESSGGFLPFAATAGGGNRRSTGSGMRTGTGTGLGIASGVGTGESRSEDVAATLRSPKRLVERERLTGRGGVESSASSGGSSSAIAPAAAGDHAGGQISKRKHGYPGVEPRNEQYGQPQRHQRGHQQGGRDGSNNGAAASTLSPRQASLLSPRSSKREESEGAPSMGSSFSDLDDASISQSALEDAYLSNMQRGGGTASRMSTISQALKSRYL